ncbi:glycosyltransferase, partial [Candidatus Woesebacteria bacterium]|nr:glycosyltransferase [Candidatus Woesebacteria bacterium]
MSLPAQTKRKAVFAVLKEGKSVTSVAKELGVARKTIYSWINRYKQTPRRNKSKALEPRYVSGKKHPRAVAPKARHKLIRLITSNPEWGCRKLSTKLKEVGFDLGYFGVNQLLSELSASTPELRKNFKRNYSGPGRLEVDIKLEIVRKVLEEKESVSQAAGEYGIARKTVYQWLKKYQAGSDKGFVGVEALKEAYVYGEAHPRAIYPKLTEKILSIVVKNPEFSVHKLKDFVPASSWTVWKILDRNNLNLYQQRLAYAEKIAASKKPILPVKVFDRIKLVWEQFIPSLAPAPPPGVIRVFKTLGVSSFFSFLFFLGIFSWMRLLGSQSFSGAVGLIFATVALTMGSVFFLYSIKYYLTLAIVLSFSQQEIGEGVNEDGRKRGFLSWILGLANGNGNNKNKQIGPVGLEPNLEHVSLKRKPYISVQIPFYNEKNVVERAITAAINFDYKGKYEVILADDSTDETTSIIRNYQKEHLAKGQKLKQVKGDGWTLTQVEVRPGVILKHIHRTSRSGFKGGALKLALKLTDPKVEFISVFDADFVPYPDTLELFLKYFKVQNNMSEDYKKSNVAVVQGYQWHVLNKSENWITRGVRSEYAGSYVIERSGREIYGARKQISGSVYMIRKDVLEEVGWETSITEDFQLTLKLYEKGYKVVYTPYIQAPAECVSTLKRLIRQRMRWAEGHSNNVKKMFKRLMFNPKLTTGEKLEFLYLSPYYLQAFFFMVGTISWLISETIFAARLPFWTSLWGWSLVLTNMLSLPLVNAVGLFLEESEEKDYTGLASFVALSYILVPFQAYASLRGFLKEEEGPWFRTPKTGKITDIFTRGRFYRFISGILPGRTQPVVAPATKKYLALSTVNSRFNPFSVRPKYRKLYSKATLSVLLIVVLLLNYLTFFVPEVAYAAAPDPTIEQQINIIDQNYQAVNNGYVPTDNSLGLIHWTAESYTGATVYFEAVARRNIGTGNGYVALFSSGGTQINNSEITITSVSWERVRSNSLTLGSLPDLQTDTDYTIRGKVDGASGIIIQSARLIIVQTDPTMISDTATQIEIGDNQNISGSTFVALDDPKYYYYDSSKFDGTVNAYFEASLQGGNLPSGATLNNFFGCETGDKNEMSDSNASPTCQTSIVRTGTYSLELNGGGITERADFPLENTDAGNKYIAGFAYRTTDKTPGVHKIFLRAKDTDGTLLIGVRLKTDGKISITDTSGTDAAISTSSININTWYYMELIWSKSDTGAAELFIDGVSRVSVSSDDFDTGVALGAYSMAAGGTDDGNYYYDDFYAYSGATDTSDFLGDAEVYGYQGAGAGYTELGDALEAGSWANVGETPGSDSNTAGYTGYPKYGGVRTNGTTRAGPSGDSNIDGDSSIKAAKWLHRLSRGNGGGTTHYKRYGNSGDGMTDTAVTLDGDLGNFFTVSESSTVVPKSTEYFEHGFGLNGARDITAAEIWSFILHVPAESILAYAKLQQCDESTGCDSETEWTDVVCGGGDCLVQSDSGDSSWELKRTSSAATMITGRRYRVAVASSGAAQNIANAKLIIEQDGGGNGLTKMEVVHQMINSETSDNTSSYNS